MLPMALLQFFISTVSNSFMVSQLFAYKQEIVDGGTKNRIWSFMSALGLIQFCFLPLTTLFPLVDFSMLSYVATAVSAVVYGLASVAHQNQIYISQEQPEKIWRLPYALHNNPYVMQSALFLSRYMAHVFLAAYIGSLVGCAFFGAPLFAYLSLANLGINYLYQQGYFPTFLRTPYLYLNVVILFSSIFGVESWLSMGLSVAMVGYTVVDYIRCQLFGTDSPTAQFPMADTTKKITLKPLEANATEATKTLNTLIKRHIKQRESLGIHVTFNHFYQSYQCVDKLISNAPVVNYDDYSTRFNALDFKLPAMREAIANEMCLHDKYNEKPFDARCAEFGLPTTVDPVDLQIAYLKREMTYFVDRLKNPSYRDLSHLSVTTLHQYARFLLNSVNNKLSTVAANKTMSERQTLLLSIALRTGSHCNRVYLDTLSSLAEEYGLLKQDSFTLQEQAVLAAQSAREEAFRTYYYTMAKELKRTNGYFALTWEDVNDYHTYEDFTLTFGANFYLRNPSLMMRFRTVFDVMQDRIVFYFFSALEKQFLFSNVYNAAYLVEQAVSPKGKLHAIFLEWCKKTYPSCYDNIVYDEYFLLNSGPELNALAELMLLDLNILGVTKPWGLDTAPPVVSKRLSFYAPSVDLRRSVLPDNQSGHTSKI